MGANEGELSRFTSLELGNDVRGDRPQYDLSLRGDHRQFINHFFNIGPKWGNQAGVGLQLRSG